MDLYYFKIWLFQFKQTHFNSFLDFAVLKFTFLANSIIIVVIYILSHNALL